MLVGERRAPARVIGVRDFARQHVDVVRIESGAPPRPGEVLVDVQDANVGLYDGRAGDTVTLVGGRGSAGRIETARLRVSGEARNLPGGEQVQDDNVIVLYATAATVAALSGEPGYSRLAFRLRRPEPRCRCAARSRRSAATSQACPGSPASATCRRCARPATGRGRRTPRSSPSS